MGTAERRSELRDNVDIVASNRSSDSSALSSLRLGSFSSRFPAFSLHFGVNFGGNWVPSQQAGEGLPTLCAK